jgi:putative flippase GtrA
MKIEKIFLKFLIIGMGTFLIDYMLYLLLVNFELDISYSKFMSSLVAVIIGYYFNSKYNFGSNNKMSYIGVAIYIIVYILLITIHVYINKILLDLLYSIHIAVFVAMSISMVLNYFSIKLYFKLLNKE